MSSMCCLSSTAKGFPNNLGDIVAGIAAADPLGPIIVPTMTLERGGARSLLEGGSWDYVIYQIVALLPGNYEPPTLPIWPEPEREFKMGSVEEFHKIVRELDRLGRAAGAKMILFPSPPRRLAPLRRRFPAGLGGHLGRTRCNCA